MLFSNNAKKIKNPDRVAGTLAFVLHNKGTTIFQKIKLFASFFALGGHNRLEQWAEQTSHRFIDSVQVGTSLPY
ncbi:MAG: hypothetical protein IKC92_05335, partial [Tidjanibacter sp.]|nr:hypothetical protein [Tidjanibacter sp.]